MLFTRQKARAGVNQESPARTQPVTNIHEGSNPRWSVFTREQNGSFILLFLQFSQENESDELHYHVLGLNEFSTEDDMKKACISLDFRFRPEKNKHSQVTEVMRIIIEAKENLESTLCHNNEISEE